jgi:ubiquinone biosynthesis protein
VLFRSRTAERVGQDPAPYEVIPKIYWDLTTEKVLTLEFIEGTSLAQIDRLVDEEGLERLAEVHPDMDIDLVLHHLTFASLRQIFEVGLFHGDPHPGNILVLTDNRVGFVDFGIFGELGPHDRDILGGQIENLALGNIDESLRFYVKQLTPTEESDPRGFRQDARSVLAEWYDVSLRSDAPISQRHVGKYMFEMINVSRRHRLLYDMSYLLYWRALNALDSTALRLSDKFDLIEELRSFFEELRPDIADRAFSVAGDRRNWAVIAALGRTGPERVNIIVDTFRAGRYEGQLLLLEPPKERNSRQNELRWLVTAVASTSLLALTAQSDVESWPRLSGIVVGMLLASLAVVRTRRR